MGWNDWYTHYDRITDKLMRQAADAMISSGMADFGYQYVNIDDCWMVKPGSNDPALGGEPRDAAGAIRPNGRFPDMKALTGYIHAKGLKAGLYTSPGPLTCAKFTGSLPARGDRRSQVRRVGLRFPEVRLVLLQRAWPAARRSKISKRPYELMGGILKKLDRDIVFNLCQYGMGDVWKWGGEVGGHCWRTTGDLGLQKDTRLPGFYAIGFKNAEQFRVRRPGPLERPRLHPDRLRGQRVPHRRTAEADHADRRTSSTATCRCGP